LARALRGRGAASASFGYLGSDAVVALLEDHGFRARPTNRRVFVATGEAMTPSERALASTPTAWHLTEYDEDS
ncbi:MAG TPA: hypothetical protein VMU47_14945, partial [Caldimonas sp.]|nr:hypothetical protein [Caldimonas sp.]